MSYWIERLVTSARNADRMFEYVKVVDSRLIERQYRNHSYLQEM